MPRFIHRKNETKSGQPYLKVVDTHTERDYIYRLEGGEFAVPSTVGHTDANGLAAASAYLENEGYTIYLDGVHPTHFEYDGAVTKA